MGCHLHMLVLCYWSLVGSLSLSCLNQYFMAPSWNSDSFFFLVPPQWPSCCRCVWCGVCCQLPAASHDTLYPREAETSPSTPRSSFVVSLVPWGLMGTQDPLDHLGPWVPWGHLGRMAQMEMMERRVKKEMQVFTNWSCFYEGFVKVNILIHGSSTIDLVWNLQTWSWFGIHEIRYKWSHSYAFIHMQQWSISCHADNVSPA